MRLQSASGGLFSRVCTLDRRHEHGFHQYAAVRHGKKNPAERPLAILATAISIFGIFYYQVTKGVSNTVLERSGAIFSYLTDRIPPQSLVELNSAADEGGPLYDEVQDLLTSVRQLTAVRYLYTARLNDQGKAVYVVDGLDPAAEDFRHIGDLIEPEVLPLLTRCLQGNPRMRTR